MKSKRDVASKTIAFVLILLGFIASIGIAGIGTYTKIKEFIDSQKPEIKTVNPFFYEGKLWFYNAEKDLISTYECKNGGTCGYAYETIDDKGYSLQYYDDGKIDVLNTVSGIFAFIIDAEPDNTDNPDLYHYNTKIQVYEIRSGKIIGEYMAIKNYSMLPDNIYIARTMSGKWGIIQFVGPEINEIVPAEYDYIGVYSPTKSLAPIDYQAYAVLKNGKWSLLDVTGKTISSPIQEPVFGYEGTTIVTKVGESSYNIYNSAGEKIAPESFETINITGKGYVTAYNTGRRVIITNNEGVLVKEAELNSGQSPVYEYDASTGEIIVKANGEIVFREQEKLPGDETPIPQISN